MQKHNKLIMTPTSRITATLAVLLGIWCIPCLSFVLQVSPTKSLFCVASQRCTGSRSPVVQQKTDCAAGFCWWLQMLQTRRSVLAKSTLLLTTIFYPRNGVVFAEDSFSMEEQGWSAVTESPLGKSVRNSVVRSERTLNKVAEQYDRFIDRLLDEKKCDPVTNRRLLNNGIRRDGTRLGDPFLGDLCDPVAMQPLNEDTLRLILSTSLEAFNRINPENNIAVQQAMQKIVSLVRPSFERSQKDEGQDMNLALYAQMRAFSELTENSSLTGKDRNRLSKIFYSTWGDKLVKELVPRANRNDFKSPLPPLDKTDYPYNAVKLFDALGIISAGLNSLQSNGFIGYWEIIIPEDDNGDVVTIAIDNDVTLPVQILLQEQGKLFKGSAVTALIAAAMEKSQIFYSLDSFFIDPSTTEREKYNPTQLLLSLSGLSGPLE